jgi:general secretion pathway protein A
MDYFSILDLNKEPFSNSPDPEFFFHSRQHLDCLQKLELSLLLRRGLNVIIGEVGTGKTTLCRQLIRRFGQKEEAETHLILDPHFRHASEFLATVAHLLTGKKPPVKRHEGQIKEYIKQYLFLKGVDQGKNIVLIIDEGQKIPPFCLEILREFLNYETNEYKLLQIVIFAQREFEKTVQKYSNFADRINLYHLLKPLSFSDTRQMIKFRLEKSSNSSKQRNLFTYPALWAIFRISGGYPRKIINLCHHSILSMIIQSRSRINYFLVRKCARRVFTEASRRWKIPLTIAAMGGAAAVILLVFQPLERLKLGESQKMREIQTEFILNSNPVIRDPIPDAETLSLNDRIIPSDVNSPDLIEPDAAPAVPKRVAEPVKTERIEEKAPLTASVDPMIEDSQADLVVEPTYSAILGRLTLKRRETLSRIIRQVYGGFNSSYLKSFIIANPEIENPDRVAVGQIISLPAIPTDVTLGDREGWWLKVDETVTLEAAFKILRNLPDGSPPVRLIPYWNPAAGSRFAVVLGKLFKDEDSARTQQGQLPTELSAGSTILSRWDEETVFFANPYFERGP